MCCVSLCYVLTDVVYSLLCLRVVCFCRSASSSSARPSYVSYGSCVYMYCCTCLLYVVSVAYNMAYITTNRTDYNRLIIV